MMGRPISEDVIRQHRGGVLRLAASIRDESLKPSSILRKLGACRQQNRLHLAPGEIGRIERSLFMPDRIENRDLRMECQAGLNKGESRHSPARAVFAHSQGRIHDRSDAAQQKRAMALNLVIAAIMFRNAPAWTRRRTISERPAGCPIQACCHSPRRSAGSTSS